MNLISWNMNRRTSNWLVLADLMREHDATAALVQEAVAPPPGLDGDLRVFTNSSQADQPWQSPIPPGTRRQFASAVAVRGAVPVEVWAPKPLADAPYGTPVISHPGQWAALGLGAPRDRLWVVSLYGLWDTMPDSKDIFAEATLHRALSDLVFLFQARSVARLVLAGDLNIWRGHGHRKWEPGYRSVFDRLGAYGLAFVGPHRTGGTPLEGCPCLGGETCSHVRTYRHQHRKESTPYQTDFVFARGVQVRRCEVLDEEGLWAHSDHCPILIEVEAS